MKSIWEATVGNDVIRIENNWFSGEKLFLNKQLQNFQVNYFNPPILTGHIKNNQERIAIKANLQQGLFGVSCILFIDDEQVALKKIK